MPITWNTGTTASNGAHVASQAITIPAGVLAGDVLIVPFSAFGLAFAPAETIQVSSTGTTPVLVGSVQNTATFSDRILNAAIFSVVAGASDAGKVITGSVVSGHDAEWAAAIGAWTGVYNSGPVDVNGAATATGVSSTGSCPSETTGAAGDWDLQIICAALAGAAYTGGAGFTQRESVVDATSGAAVAIFDSNGPVGGAGTSIGGATFANAGNSSWWAGFTVGLSPVPSGTLAPAGLASSSAAAGAGADSVRLGMTIRGT